MKIKELVEKYSLKELTKIYQPEREISGGYSGDLLSDVIANAKKDNIWITMQTHLNIVAVATLKEIAVIVIVMNKEVPPETLKKAEEEQITILKTELTSFQISGKTYPEIL
ncbi:MAG: hypothetical protein FJ216_04280 [Ignavibacteria bacterium]|nr:hypothetical protein [Ignavibacteria bacterium]